MLLIRAEQMRALNQHVRQNQRDRLVWQYASRAAEFGLDPCFLAAHIDEGLAECRRFRVGHERDVDLFLRTVLQHYGGFLPGPVAYPARAMRFLADTNSPAQERVRRFAEWTELELGQAKTTSSE
jgi:hypothetical protein